MAWSPINEGRLNVKTKNGRKARASMPAIMVGVRVTAEERVRFLDAADKRGDKSLSDFLRAAANELASKIA